jgi:hypothetical protein
MKSRFWGILFRAGVVAGVIWFICFMLTVANSGIQVVLRWIDMLSPVPGLSGVAIIILFPAATLLVFVLVNWVCVGFEPRADPTPEPES